MPHSPLTRRAALSLIAGTGLAAVGGAGFATRAAASTTFVITNCTTSVNLRSGPGTSYAKVGSITKGSTFTGEQSGVWVKITSGPFNGRWVSSTYAQPTGASTPTTPSPSSGGYVTTITGVTGGASIRAGENGTRVYLIRRFFGTDAPTSAGGSYDSATRSRVVAFQRARGLTADGVVGKNTWPHFNTGRPFDIDAYQVQPQLPVSADAAQRREKMIEFALAQRGSRYCWGGAGPYELGFDCSGLVLQALYAAGLDPQPINVVKHAAPTYRTSRELYASGRLQSVPAAQRQRGDLIFYMDRSNTVVHVAIDLGDGTMMESYGATAAIRTVPTAYGASHMAPSVKRPF